MAIARLCRGPPIDTPRVRPPSPSQAARWITTTPSGRGLHATEALRRLFEHCAELERTHDLVRQLATMRDARDAAPLPDWLDQLAASRLAALAGLAKALREDPPAVVQGITTAFNSGVNEGRITDLKLQKRIMAGRAGIPLRRHRVILMDLPRHRYAHPSFTKRISPRPHQSVRRHLHPPPGQPEPRRSRSLPQCRSWLPCPGSVAGV
ncbi:hypothetical protein [Streptomyces sp. NPDC054837]